jgi:hypothetical protein
LAGPSSAFAVSDGVLFTADGTELVEYPAGRSGAYVVPVVASINPWAFAGAAHLPSVTFAAGGTVSSIPAAAFLMSSLTSITLPATVTAVGYMAFESSHSLTSVRFLGDAPSFDSETFTDTAMGAVYYRPSTTGWDTAFAGPLSGLTPVRMVAPTYGTGDPADQPATVSGRAGVNRKLSAHAGSWASDVAVSTRYAWYSCSKRVSGVSSKLTKGAKCSLIAGQKGSSFKVGKKYKGTYIVAAIRVANEFGSGTVFTGSTAKVK